MHQAHAIKTGISQRLTEYDGVLRSVPPHGVYQRLNFQVYGHNHPSHFLHKAKRCFYRYYQTVKTTNLKSLDTFKNKLSVIESYDIVIGTDPGLSKEELSGVANVTDIYKQAASEA